MRRWIGIIGGVTFGVLLITALHAHYIDARAANPTAADEGTFTKHFLYALIAGTPTSWIFYYGATLLNESAVGKTVSVDYLRVLYISIVLNWTTVGYVFGKWVGRS